MAYTDFMFTEGYISEATAEDMRDHIMDFKAFAVEDDDA